MFFSGMFLLARLYTKAFIVRAFKWEDCQLPSHDFLHDMDIDAQDFRYLYPRFCKDHLPKPTIFRWTGTLTALYQAFFCGWTALKFKVTNAGGGVHQWNLTTQDLSDQYRVRYPSSVPFP